jgi:hypothetical protein
MRVDRLELVPYSLRFREPYVTARGRLERRELLLVRVHTDEGVDGLGEAAPLALRGGPSLQQIRDELEGLRGRLEAIEASPEARPGDLIAPFAGSLSRQALAALDIALHDLLGKLRGEPVWRLLGAERAGAVNCNATLSTGSPATVAGEVERWAARGFETFKLKVGAGDDVEQVGAVRAALGPGARIRIDANASWDEAEALETLRRLEPLDVELAEQPVASIAEMGRLAGKPRSRWLPTSRSSLRRTQARPPRPAAGSPRPRSPRSAASQPESRSLARFPRTSLARSTGPWASPPPLTGCRPPCPPGSPTGWRPLCCSRRRSPRASASWKVRPCGSRMRPGWESSSTRGR